MVESPNKLFREMPPETAEKIIAGALAYYRGCSEEMLAKQIWIALTGHARNKPTVREQTEDEDRSEHESFFQEREPY